MIPGPELVYECPNCKNLLTKGSLRSGNTVGVEIFSDIKRIAPMLPEFPNLTKCKKCNNYLWLSELEEIGAYYEWDKKSNREWVNADKAEFLKIDEYFDALKLGFAVNKDEEYFIRLKIWRAYNDRKRNNQKMFIDKNDESKWKENCLILVDFLNFYDINQRLMIAEINRNLGNFEKCIEVINTIEDKDLNVVKEKYLMECKRKNKWVFRLA